MCRIPALLIAFLCLIPPRETLLTGTAEMHLWRGEFDDAPDAPSDSLRCALVAFKNGNFDEALALSGSVHENPLLDAYRRYIRGVSLFRSERPAESALELDSLLALIQDNGETANHPIAGLAVNAYVEAMAACPDPAPTSARSLSRIDALSGRSRFLLARICLQGSRTEEASRWFFAGLEAACDSAAFPLFEEIARDSLFALSALDRSRVEAIARYALNRPTSRIARQAISYLRETHGGEGTVRLLDALSHAAAGEKRRAISIARGLFASKADVALKKRALLLAASWQYGEKQYRSAQESYRIFGMYYPSDDRSSWALDVAARIAVARKRWDEAFSIWETLRSRAPDCPLAQQSALSEAALRCHIGSGTDAHRVLEELLPRAAPSFKAGILYWLFRTAATSEAAGRWRQRLIEAYPRSAYSSAALGAGTLFDLAGPRVDHRDAVDLLAEMERVERSLFAAAAHAPDSVAASAVYGAFRYFLSRGLHEETEECGRHLAGTRGRERETMMVLYRDARSRGMIGLALSLLMTPALSNPAAGLPEPLRYPVAYAGLIGETSIEHDLPPILILAVIREESRFDPTAISRAGAVGLMQLMPATGAWLASKLGIDDYTERQLLSPSFNISAGTWYIHHLAKRSDGSLIAALAAYNAGYGRIADWIRTFEPAHEPMIAVELIGIRETREYVKRVLDTMAAYRSLYAAEERDES